MTQNPETLQYERLIQERRKHEDVQKIDKKNAWEDMYAKENTERVEKAIQKQLNHQLYDQQNELCQEQRILERLDDREQEAYRVAQEQLLADQLAKLRDDQLCDEKVRLRMREESQELKELERQLYMAYVNKERYLQLQQKRLEKHRQQMEKERDAKANEEYRKTHDFETEEKEKMRKAAITRYMEGLRRQFIEKDMKKETEYKEYVKDKALIDEIVKQIEEEDKRKVRERTDRIERIRQEMEEELASRERQREEAKLANMQRDKLACDYAEEIERREQAVIDARKERLKELRQLQERLGGELMEHQRCKEEEDMLRLELDAEERRKMMEKEERDEVERAMCRIQEMKRAIEQQLIEKREARRNEELNRQARHKEMMAKLADEKRLELLTLAARRRKELENRRIVEQMMEENRKKRDDEIAQLCYEKRELERIEADRMRLVEMERRRLLEQHAIKLVDFLPKGVFRDRRELEEIGGWSQVVEEQRNKEEEAGLVRICGENCEQDQ